MIAQTLAFVHACGRDVFGEFWFFVWAMVKLGCVMGGVLFMVAYLTLWERKMIGWMHVRVGPNRTGPLGLLQPVADGLKLLFKEIVIPEKADKKLFCLAPILAMTPALAAWAVMPFGPEMALANLDAGILFFMTMTSVGVYGIIIAGWASNSRYAFLGAMRAAAQMISFGVPMGFVLVTVLMVSGSANLTEIVAVQGRGFFAGHGLNFLSWNWIPLLPLCFIFVVCSLAETGRHPFDAPEGESEIVAGHMVEYSGMAFGMFFMAEYANMILFSTMTAILFMGGWLPPTDWSALAWVPGWIWLGAKTFFVVSAFIWIRGTFPRYRYDHTMRLGWKIFLPITLACLVGVACWMRTPWNIWV